MDHLPQRPDVSADPSTTHAVVAARKRLPAIVKERGLVVDLDRVMTVEKAVVASWRRTPGCTSDQERRNLARALARKRARPAFPDDFVNFSSKLVERLRHKHDKNSDEGRALRALREIRVRAAPSWDSDRIEITFWVIPDSGDIDFEGRGWDAYLDAWLKRVPVGGRFTRVEGIVCSLEGLTARDYVESDRLVLDHLSDSNH